MATARQQERHRIAKRIAKNVKEIRLGKALSLDQAAQCTGLSIQDLKRIEAAEHVPGGVHLLQLAVGFGVTTDALLRDPAAPGPLGLDVQFAVLQQQYKTILSRTARLLCCVEPQHRPCLDLGECPLGFDHP